MSEHSDNALFPWETEAPAAAPMGDAARASTNDAIEDAPARHGDAMAQDREAHAAEPDRATAATGAEESGGSRRGERPLVRKEYYSISEVADLVGLPAHVLRYWESQFSVLNPSKNRSGNRVYQRKEIRLILLVKQLLYDEKYTVEGAKQKLEQLRRGGSLGEATGRALDAQLVRVMRDELRHLLQILTPDTA